jgi:hypothetical protein
MHAAQACWGQERVELKKLEKVELQKLEKVQLEKLQLQKLDLAVHWHLDQDQAVHLHQETVDLVRLHQARKHSEAVQVEVVVQLEKPSRELLQLDWPVLLKAQP